MSTHSRKGPFTVLGLGELVLRVADMDAMLDFYTNTLGLELLRRFDDEVAFMKIAEGAAGQVQTLTLFNRRKLSNFDNSEWPGWDPARSSLHHFALTISVPDYEAMQAYVKEHEVPHNIAVHTWIGWRSIFLRDPEGNTAELVCYDPRYDAHAEYDYNKLHGDPLGRR